VERFFNSNADIVGGKLVIAATTAHGILVASSSAASLRFTIKEYAAPATLMYPAMLPAGAGKVTFLRARCGGLG